MAVTIVSTTDTPEQVTQAVGMYSKKPVAEAKETKSAPVVEAETKVEAASSENKEVTEPSEGQTEPVDTQTTEDVDLAQNTEVQVPDKNAVKEKKGGFQRRIDKLTKARTEAEKERDYWREAALKTKPEEQSQVSAQTQQFAKDVETEPDPNKFEDVGSYLKEFTKWSIKQESKKSDLARKTADAQVALESKVGEFQKKVGEFKKATADYDDVALEFDEAYPSGVPKIMLDIISESDHGPQMLYDIAKDHAEFEKLSKLSPIALAREIGRREAKISVQSVSGQQTTQNKATKAPAPISPVRNGTAVSTKDYRGEVPYREYVAARAKGVI